MRADRGEVLVADPVKQGEARVERNERQLFENEGAALEIEEFAAMVDAARAGGITADVQRARD
ncbi:hypothetical protein D3C83_183240 [compost metagenome]